MGMSRPAVESHALPRPPAPDRGVRRPRLRRSAASASRRSSSPPAQPRSGTRDTRRLARHLSHCQPCRRVAVAAGLDAAAMARKPVRRAIERAAAFLPLPAFLRSRFLAAEQMVPVSEPMAAAWSKAVAVAATIVVAGVGAGVAPHGGGKPPALKPDKTKPASAATRSSAPPSTTRARRPLAVAPSHTAVKSKTRSAGRNSASLGKSRSGGRAAQQHPARRRAGGDAAKAPTQNKPAAVNPTSSSPKPTQGVHAPRRAAAPRRRASRRSSCRRSIRASARRRPAARSTRRAADDPDRQRHGGDGSGHRRQRDGRAADAESPARGELRRGLSPSP